MPFWRPGTGIAIGMALFSAGMALSAAPLQADEAVFKAQCAKCHVDAAALAKKIDGASPDEKRDYLSRFLEAHMKSDPANRASLIEFLMSQPAN